MTAPQKAAPSAPTRRPLGPDEPGAVATVWPDVGEARYDPARDQVTLTAGDWPAPAFLQAGGWVRQTRTEFGRLVGLADRMRSAEYSWDQACGDLMASDRTSLAKLVWLALEERQKNGAGREDMEEGVGPADLAQILNCTVDEARAALQALAAAGWAEDTPRGWYALAGPTLLPDTGGPPCPACGQAYDGFDAHKHVHRWLCGSTLDGQRRPWGTDARWTPRALPSGFSRGLGCTPAFVVDRGAAGHALDEIRRIIEAVDRRALAGAGPFPSTDQAITLQEIRQIYRWAGGTPVGGTET